MTGKLSCNIKCLLISLLILAGIDGTLFSQTSISGTINKYGRVTAIGTDNVIISDATQFSYFAVGDTVLLIQMKGAECLVAEDGTYGQYQISAGTTGIYEFVTVLSIESLSKKVTFRNNIVYAYSVLGDVQLVRVPSYNAAKVIAELTCPAWDSISKVGGIVSLFVGTTLTLNDNINVKAKGFIGGAPVTGDGICIQTGSGLNNFSYDLSYQNSGLKGESQVSNAYPVLNPIYPGYAKGYGANFTGGGGGSGRYSGGGGGSLIGIGGKGGLEKGDLCTISREYGGIGGYSVAPVLSSAGVYLGGGGGGSTHLTGVTTTSSGGNGGGIIIIVCQTLDGNNKSILADGETPGVASGDAGSGGGGGGGTIAIYTSGFSANDMTLSANGGAGGNNAGQFGEGGGGGGGRVTLSNISIPGTVTRTVNGGTYGTRSGIGHDAIAGSAGDKPTTFVPVLNGFLFNSIYSSVTKTQVDSICSNTPMGEISGTQPVGGTFPYTYLWEYSVTSGTAGFSPAPGTNNLSTYTPPAILIQTTWFRRTITDASTTPIVDISKAVEIIVHQAITGNLIGNDTTICYSQDPHKLRPINSGPSNGNGHYTYQWLSNTDNATWTNNASGTSTLPDYDPSALLINTYYKRKVTSGRCVDNSATATITVLPLITGNVTTRPDSVICQGSLFNVISASAASGGSGAYVYQWLDSTLASTWLPAAGTNSNPTYSADTSKFTTTEDRFYRRVVYSGPANVCENKSVPIHLTRYHKIKNNLISADQTICSGTVPSPFTGTTPTQGNLSYTYQWQDSISGSAWAAASGTSNQLNYSPTNPLTLKTWYRRISISGLNNCCINASPAVTVGINPLPAGNITTVADTSICSGSQVKFNVSLTGATGWTVKYNENSTQVTVNSISSSPATISRIPVVSKDTTILNYTLASVTDNNGCINTSLTGAKKAIVYRVPVPNAGPDDKVCGPVYTLQAVSHYGTGKWSFPPQVLSAAVSNPHSIIKIDSSLLTTTSNSYQFYWIEKNWTCKDSDAVTITFYHRIYSADAGPGGEVNTFDNIAKAKVNASPLLSYQIGKWSVVEGAGDFDDNTKSSANVSNISLGTNKFLWTVYNKDNALCNLSDTVIFEVSHPVIPQGISPNGDRINDTLTISGLDLINQDADLAILNGAGTLVFSSNNRNQQRRLATWYGKDSKGLDLPEGTYYYLLKVFTKTDGNISKYKGFIILKRH